MTELVKNVYVIEGIKKQFILTTYLPNYIINEYFLDMLDTEREKELDEVWSVPNFNVYLSDAKKITNMAIEHCCSRLYGNSISAYLCSTLIDEKCRNNGKVIILEDEIIHEISDFFSLKSEKTNCWNYAGIHQFLCFVQEQKNNISENYVFGIELQPNIIRVCCRSPSDLSNTSIEIPYLEQEATNKIYQLSPSLPTNLVIVDK